MNTILEFIAKNQPVAKASVLDAISSQIDRLVADGTLVAVKRPTIGGEILFYSLAEEDYPFAEGWLERQSQPLPEFSKPKAALPIGKDKLAKQLF